MPRGGEVLRCGGLGGGAEVWRVRGEVLRGRGVPLCHCLVSYVLSHR